MKVFINDLSHPTNAGVAALLASKGYSIVGSITTSLTSAPLSFGKYTTAEASDLLAVKNLMLSADTIILSLFTSRPDDVDELLTVLAYIDLNERKQFILLSTVFTWARTDRPSTGQSGPSALNPHFSEDNYNARKPAASWSEWKLLENQVLLGPVSEKVRSCVVASGLVYDDTGGMFKPLLRSAYLSGMEPLVMPCIGAGANILPTIHLDDLSALIYSLIRSGGSFPKPYILAVDRGSASLADIAKGFSTALGSGQVVPMTKAQFQDYILDDPKAAELQLNLCFDMSGSAIDSLMESGSLSLRYYDGILSCADHIAQSYLATSKGAVKIHARLLVVCGLQYLNPEPVRILVTGPPGVGKTNLSQALAQKYRLPLLDTIRVLSLAATLTQDPDLRAKAQEALATPSSPQLTAPALLTSCVREVLKSKPCQTQGYVLDGVVLSPEEFKLDFCDRRYGESPTPTDPPPEILDLDPSLAPGYVIYLDASDSFITSRLGGNVDNTFTTQLGKFRSPDPPPLAPNWTPPPVKGKAKAPPPPPVETLPALLKRMIPRSPLMVQVDAPEAPPTFEQASTFMEQQVSPSWAKYQARLSGSTATDEPIQLKKVEVPVGPPATLSVSFNMGPAAAPLDGPAACLTDNKVQDIPAAATRRRRSSASLPNMTSDELRHLEVESSHYRNYLLENVMPTLATAMLHVKQQSIEDPIEYIAQMLLEEGKQAEIRAEAEAFLQYKGAVAKAKAEFDRELAEAMKQGGIED